jgi:imidazole glycerol phosphate synthase glutamine amidotransferase subunit
MSLKKRLIARLDVKGSRLIKGIRFEGLRVVGDPYEASVLYAAQGADELFYADAVASLYGRNSLGDLLTRTCRNVFIPITAGGGVRSLEDAGNLLAAGADKIAINTAAVREPSLITSLATRFGCQCVVLSIQARRSQLMASGWEVMVESGRERTGLDVIDWISQSQQLGVGEILVTSVDQDGTCQGPDQDLICSVSGATYLPLVVSGGFADAASIRWAMQEQSVSGVAVGAALHHDKIRIDALKDMISADQDGPLLRLVPPVEGSKSTGALLNDVEIAIVDYAMGNQRSLMNALQSLGASVSLTNDADDLARAHLRILPGVGAFPAGMEELKKRGLDQYLSHLVLEGRPLIGICLGMQLLFEEGVEFIPTQGLGMLPGHVVSLLDLPHSNGETDSRLILPHMGWNQLNYMEGIVPLPIRESSLDSSFYFVHSFSAVMSDTCDFKMFTNYGARQVLSLCAKGCVLGFQFHPERSGEAGLRILAAAISYLCR